MARAPETERYPYHNRTECPVGQRVKKSGDWQYYLGRPGEERQLCTQFAELGRVPGGQASADNSSAS